MHLRELAREVARIGSKQRSEMQHIERLVTISTAIQALCAVLTVFFTLAAFGYDRWEKGESRKQEILETEKTIRPLINIGFKANPPSMYLSNFGGGAAIIKDFQIIQKPGWVVFKIPKPGAASSPTFGQDFNRGAEQASALALKMVDLEAITGDGGIKSRANIPGVGSVIPANSTQDIFFVRDWPEYLENKDSFTQGLIREWGNNLARSDYYVRIEFTSFTERSCYLYFSGAPETKMCEAENTLSESKG